MFRWVHVSCQSVIRLRDRQPSRRSIDITGNKSEKPDGLRARIDTHSALQPPPGWRLRAHFNSVDAVTLEALFPFEALVSVRLARLEAIWPSSEAI